MCECGLNVPHEKWDSPCTLGVGFSDTPPAKRMPAKERRHHSWRMGERSAKIIDSYYAKLYLEPSIIDRCESLVEMKGLKSQRDLIESRWEEYDNETKKWATKSLIHIANEIRRLDPMGSPSP